MVCCCKGETIVLRLGYFQQSKTHDGGISVYFDIKLLSPHEAEVGIPQDKTGVPVMERSSAFTVIDLPLETRGTGGGHATRHSGKIQIDR
jgi:hypothetical protein